MAKYLLIELSMRRVKLSRTITKALAAAGLAALFWAPYHSALAQEEAVIEAGREQFSQKCAVCHGLEAKGDGRLAPHLKEQPSDLSLLSKKNGGTFPFWETYGKIDGRDIEIVRTHGTAEMPVWGTDEQYEGSTGRLAMCQILEIVFFLQSIQEE